MKHPLLVKCAVLGLSLPWLAGCVEHEVVYRDRPAPPPPGYAPPPPSEGVGEEAPPPPAPQVEVVTTAPGPLDAWFWAPGVWEWRGHWVWMGGHWVRRPHPGAVWVGAHWGYHGHHRVWVGGGWH